MRPSVKAQKASPMSKAVVAWGIASLVLSVVLAGLLSISPLNDDDLWWHLATGRHILTGGGIPHTDPFTYTAAGRPWITHEWLSEVLFYTVERAGGVNLLVLFKALLAAGAVALGAAAGLVGPRSRERLTGAALGALLAAPLIALRAVVRPHMLTAVCLGLLLLLLRLESHTGRRRWRLALIPLFLVWANLHSGFMLGFLLVLLYWAGEAVSIRRGGAVRPALWKDRGLILLLAFGASFLNPHHIEAHLYPLRLMARAEVRDTIVELRSVFHPAYRGAVFLKALALASVAGVLLVLGSRKRIDPALLLAGIVFAALGFSSIRGLSEFAVLLPAVLAAHSALLARRRRINLALYTAIALVASLGGVAAVVRGVPVGTGTPHRIGFGVESGSTPASAARFLRENRPPGRLFNLLSNGGYLIHELAPETTVYIDGRLDVFPPGFLSAYTRMLETGEGWDEAVERFGITTAVVNYVPHDEQDWGLRARLRRDPRWVCVLAGDFHLVYARAVPENAAVLGRFGIPFDPSARSRDFLGEFLSKASRADLDVAIHGLENMVRIAPDEIAPSLFLGQLLDRTQRSGGAIPHLRHALSLEKGPSSPIRLYLAGALQRADSLDAARRELDSILRSDPKDVAALAQLALLERSAGRREAAIELLVKAESISPNDATVQVRLGVLHAEGGRMEEAERHLRRAQALRPGDPYVLSNVRAFEALKAQRRTPAGSRRDP